MFNGLVNLSDQIIIIIIIVNYDIRHVYNIDSNAFIISYGNMKQFFFLPKVYNISNI